MWQARSSWWHVITYDAELVGPNSCEGLTQQLHSPSLPSHPHTLTLSQTRGPNHLHFIRSSMSAACVNCVLKAVYTCRRRYHVVIQQC
jgi:hypothetical protein